MILPYICGCCVSGVRMSSARGVRASLRNCHRLGINGGTVVRAGGPISLCPQKVSSGPISDPLPVEFWPFHFRSQNDFLSSGSEVISLFLFFVCNFNVVVCNLKRLKYSLFFRALFSIHYWVWRTTTLLCIYIYIYICVGKMSPGGPNTVFPRFFGPREEP